MSQLNIGQVAKQTGISVEAIRFYEKQGLIEVPLRSASGYRQYQAATVKRIRFIQRAKEVGFTLKDVNELLSLRREPGATCTDIKLQATQKIEEIDQKIHDLGQIRSALASMIMKCRGRGSLAECPILEELEMDKK